MCVEETGKRLPTVLVAAYLVSARAAASWTPAVPLGPQESPAMGSSGVGGSD